MVRSELLGSLIFPVPALFAVLYCSPFCIALVSLGEFSSVEVFSQGHKFTHFVYFSFSNPSRSRPNHFSVCSSSHRSPAKTLNYLQGGKYPPVHCPTPTPLHVFVENAGSPRKTSLRGGGRGGQLWAKDWSQITTRQRKSIVCARLKRNVRHYQKDQGWWAAPGNGLHLLVCDLHKDPMLPAPASLCVPLGPFSGPLGGKASIPRLGDCRGDGYSPRKDASGC